jgi:hypothetical protein
MLSCFAFGGAGFACLATLSADQRESHETGKVGRPLRGSRGFDRQGDKDTKKSGGATFSRVPITLFSLTFSEVSPVKRVVNQPLADLPQAETIATFSHLA